jgi:putative phosphotransacetylase
MAKILIETSARHVHVTQEVLEQLFGAGAQLTVKKELSQPGQFASEQKVTVLGPVNPKTGKQGSLTCSILGPVRSHNQVEVSFTDARTLGVKAPIRESGDVAGSAACTLVGPAGSVELSEGVIVAKRHIHMTPEDAEAEGVKNGDIVSVQVENETGRKLVFQDTVVRVSKNYALAMHIDTDESNAGMVGNAFGEIIK